MISKFGIILMIQVGWRPVRSIPEPASHVIQLEAQVVGMPVNAWQRYRSKWTRWHRYVKCKRHFVCIARQSFIKFRDHVKHPTWAINARNVLHPCISTACNRPWLYARGYISPVGFAMRTKKHTWLLRLCVDVCDMIIQTVSNRYTVRIRFIPYVFYL